MTRREAKSITLINDIDVGAGYLYGDDGERPVTYYRTPWALVPLACLITGVLVGLLR